MDVKIEWRDIAKLKLLPGNAKDHDVGAIARSIARFGLAEPPCWNVQTEHVFSGNGRLEALRVMKLNGYTAWDAAVQNWGRQTREPPSGVREDGQAWLVPVAVFDIEVQEEKALAIALNRTNELGGWNYNELTVTLSNLATEAAGLEGTGFDASDLDSMLAFSAMTQNVEAPDLAGWEDPPTEYHLVVRCDDAQQMEAAVSFLGLEPSEARKRSVHITDTKILNGGD